MKQENQQNARQLAEAEFARIPKNAHQIDKRKQAVLSFVDEATRRCRAIHICVPKAFARLELTTTCGYEWIDDAENITLASALWILDALRRSGKLREAYEFLPDSVVEVQDCYIPTDFYHPCYSQDLVRSMVCAISPNWRETQEFRDLMALLGDDVSNKTYVARASTSGRVAAAVETFKALQWQVIERVMKIEEYYTELQESMDRRLHSQPSVLEVKPAILSEEERAKLLEERRNLDIECETLYDELHQYIGTNARTIMGKRELGRILSGFRISDPYEICFAMTYLLAKDDPQIWLTKAAETVVLVAARMLPWHWDDEEIEDADEWDVGMDFNQNGWLDRETEPETVDLYHSAETPNLAQKIYRLSRGIVPVGLHPFAAERKEMMERGEENADFVADWAEILFLGGFRAEAENLREFDWRTLWTMEVAQEDAAELSEQEDLKGELDRLRRENKSLRKALSESIRASVTTSEKYEQELKALRQEHRELADLRELVFHAELSEDERARREPPTKQSCYPYTTRKRTVVFGGHDSFLRVIKPMLPTVRFVEKENLTFSPEIIKNADVVWVQTNSISHSMYWSVAKTCKRYGVQLRYFGYASAEKCAEQLMAEDGKDLTV